MRYGRAWGGPISFSAIMVKTFRQEILDQRWWETWKVEIPGWPVIEPVQCPACRGLGWIATQTGPHDWEQCQCSECEDGYEGDRDWDLVDPYPIEH